MALRVLAPILVAGLLAGVWWHFYVIPADEFRAEVIDCMLEHGEVSKSMYDTCVNLLTDGVCPH